MSRKSAIFALVTLTVVVIVAALVSPRTPQPLSYHNFADQRAWLGIPNFGDVPPTSPSPSSVHGVFGSCCD